MNKNMLQYIVTRIKSFESKEEALAYALQGKEDMDNTPDGRANFSIEMATESERKFMTVEQLEAE